MDQPQDEEATAPVNGAAQPAIDAASPDAAYVLPAAPLTGSHVDAEGSGYQAAGYQVARSAPQRNHKAKAIELVLRSTPPGAIASIDGKPIGNTPTYWHGFADGKAHEYTFTKKGYSMARYRFVSTQSGVVHGSLNKLVLRSEPTPPKATK
jgi:hypothetical protein